MTSVINDSPLPSGPTSVAGGRKDGNQCMTMASSFPFFGEDLSLQIMQQQLELDRLIYVHMEKVRLDMEERGRTQSQRIVATILEAITKRLRNMEDEVEKVGKLNWMLEERVKSLCIENQIWRNLAQTNEATANALRTNLQQLLAHARDDPAPVLDESAAAMDDAHSCCGSSGHGGGDEETEEERERWQKVARTAGVGVERIWEENDDHHHGKGGGSKGWNCYGKSNSNSNNNKRSCRKCGMAESSVLLLPCRHLCLCAGCGPTINACPICNSVKSASVHVNLS
ncbi:hypothetical protein Nepgr_001174 [Nepenthes gracilis]|uniref:RING-type domain-containing protein n=1 Tax=Nepenthes gracilis TaxID=150966 RepID=A0AAD3P5K7_NEPGR|nr:hypothetical protein Nepgr_001174 [Nepenthes gracilis]